MHVGNSNSEPGMVKAWHVVPHGKPPFGLMLRVRQTTTRDEHYLD